MSFTNVVPNEAQAGQVIPPAIQYHRGDLSNSDALLRDGCWQLPTESWRNIIGGEIATANVTHAGGVIVESYLLHSIDVAVLAYQKRWFKYVDGSPVYGPYEPGSKSRFRMMAYVRELVSVCNYSEPVIITVSGLNAKHVEDSIKRFQNEAIAAANRLTTHRWPLYGFWMTLASIGKVDTRQGQYVTPPAWELEQDLDRDALDLMFVGEELLELAAMRYDDAQKWARGPEPEPTPEPEQMGAMAPYMPAPAMAEEEAF